MSHDDELQAGNALNSASIQLALLVGAGAAGVIISRWQSGFALALDALTFVVSALTLLFMSSQRRTTTPLADGEAGLDSLAATKENLFPLFRYQRQNWFPSIISRAILWLCIQRYCKRGKFFPETMRQNMALEELQNGRYRRVRLVGSGGMGEVYLMEDTRVSRQVAIKVLHSEIAPYPDSDASKDAARLFQREARAIAALEHPNILPLYDFGEETLEDTTITYMVMPFTSEGSLATWLRQRGGLLSPKDVAYLIGQAAEGLQYAHDHQVIHLDVKPSNFLLRSNAKNPNRPTVLLADFGVAHSSSTTSGSSRTIRGTPTAMAPEHWSSQPVPASDQYALAVMAYEMLTGRTPFTGSMEQLMYQHFTAQPAAPSIYNPYLPPTVDAVILRALAKKPEDRFPSIAAFANALEQAVNDTLFAGSAPSPQAISAVPTLLNQKDASLPEAISAAPTQLASNPALAKSFGSDQNIPTVAAPDFSGQKAGIPSQLVPAQKKGLASPARTFSIIGIVVLLLFAGSGLYYGFQVYNNQQANKAMLAHSETATASASAIKPTSTPTLASTVPPGLYIADTYNGSLLDETTNQTTYITVSISQHKGSGSFNGTMTYKSSQQAYPLQGVVDLQGNFSFTVQQASGQTPLYISGAVQHQSDGTYLKGQYCNSSTNSCPANASSGYFYVGPGY